MADSRIKNGLTLGSVRPLWVLFAGGSCFDSLQSIEHIVIDQLIGTADEVTFIATDRLVDAYHPKGLIRFRYGIDGGVGEVGNRSASLIRSPRE